MGVRSAYCVLCCCDSAAAGELHKVLQGDGVHTEYLRQPEHLFVVQEALETVRFTKLLSPPDKARLCRMAAFVAVNVGDVVCRRGDASSKLFMLVAGTVDVVSSHFGVIETLASGDSFGHEGADLEVGELTRVGRCHALLVLTSRPDPLCVTVFGVQHVNAMLVATSPARLLVVDKTDIKVGRCWCLLPMRSLCHPLLLCVFVPT